MSLILEALKQADSERSENTRGSTPGVFSQPFTAPATPLRTSGRRDLPWLMLAALASGLLWFARPHLSRVDSPRPTHPTAPASAQALAEKAASIALPPQVPPQALAQVVVPPAVTQVPPPISALFRTEPPAAAAPASLDPSAAPPNTTLPTNLNTSALAAAGPSAPSGTVPLPRAEQLPADVRTQLPSLLVTGHTYSDNPTLRMLMVDGHMVVEGQAIAPGLRLERIGPHQAIFNHRGTRFSVGY